MFKTWLLKKWSCTIAKWIFLNNIFNIIYYITLLYFSCALTLLYFCSLPPKANPNYIHGFIYMHCDDYQPRRALAANHRSPSLSRGSWRHLGLSVRGIFRLNRMWKMLNKRFINNVADMLFVKCFCTIYSLYSNQFKCCKNCASLLSRRSCLFQEIGTCHGL